VITDKPIIGAVGVGATASKPTYQFENPAVPEMTGPEKAAILMITLGLEISSTIFKFLRQDEVETIVLEIAKISTVPIDKRDAVITEAYQRAIALKYINEGGIEYAKEILERSFGAGQADDMTNRLFAALKHGNPLELVKKTEPGQLLEFIREEHPQTIALILVYMVFVVIASLFLGRLSDRLGRRKVFVFVASALQGIAALLLAFFPTFTITLVGGALLGLGYGCFLSVDQALATQVLPDPESRGKDLGIMNIATAVPQALAPLLGAAAVAVLSGFVGLFVLSALFAFAGALAVAKVKSVR